MYEEPLSTELSEWADGAEEGLVIFCLGHTIHLGRCSVFMILYRVTHPADFKTKVPFWPGLTWPSQAKVELLF